MIVNNKIAEFNSIFFVLLFQTTIQGCEFLS